MSIILRAAGGSPPRDTPNSPLAISSVSAFSIHCVALCAKMLFSCGNCGNTSAAVGADFSSPDVAHSA